MTTKTNLAHASCDLHAKMLQREIDERNATIVRMQGLLEGRGLQDNQRSLQQWQQAERERETLRARILHLEGCAQKDADAIDDLQQTNRMLEGTVRELAQRVVQERKSAEAAAKAASVKLQKAEARVREIEKAWERHEARVDRLTNAERRELELLREERERDFPNWCKRNGIEDPRKNLDGHTHTP